MVEVLPHGFSRSPVEKVECSWRSTIPLVITGEISPGTLFYDEPGKYTLVFGSPYPGWAAIAGRITEVLHSVTDTRGTIFRCGLSFTDRFILSPGDEISSLFSLSRFFPSIEEPGMSTKQLVCTIRSSSYTDTLAQITFFCENKMERSVHIVFHLYSVSDTGIRAENAISWFEAAHNEIHLLFDAIVTEKMMKRLA